jgi:hypothetical protein
MSFSKSIKAMSIDDLEILKKSLEAQLRDVRAAIKKHASDDEDSGSETESSSKSSKKPKTAKKPATPRKPTAWAAWTKAVKEKYAKEYAKESEKFKNAHDGKLAGKGIGGFAIIFAKMMREKHEDDYAEFEAEVKSANASEASSDEKPAKKAAAKKPKSKKAPKASAAETEDEAEEAAEEEAAAPTEIQASECDWKVMPINGTKYAYETKTRGCWNRNEDKTRADWAGLYDPETKKLDTSAPEIVITE